MTTSPASPTPPAPDRHQVELAVTGVTPDPAGPDDLAGALAPRDSDVEAARVAARHAGADLGDDVITAVLGEFAARLADRLPPYTGAVADCPHGDITGNRCEGCGAPVVIQCALSLTDLKGAAGGGVDGMVRAHLTAATPLVTDSGQPARLVVRPADVTVAAKHYASVTSETVDSDGMHAALQSYARRIELGLAVGIATAGPRPTLGDTEAQTAADQALAGDR